MLGQVSPALLSPTPWMAYISVHIVVSLFLYLVPVRIHHPTMDLGLFWLDAGTKSGAIFAAMAGCAAHPNPAVRQSIVAPVLLGAIAPIGGGTLGAMLSVHEQNWGFTSPPFIKPGNGFLSTLDIWSAALSVLMHGVLTQSHPAYEPWRETFGIPYKGAFTDLGAKAVVVSFLMLAYGTRAVYSYIPHLSRPVSQTSKTSSISAAPSQRNGPVEASNKKGKKSQ